MALINVQLEANGPITQMDESLLERHDGVYEDEDERTTWIEYWIPGTYRPGKIDGYLADRPHRSVHVHLKRPMVFAEGALGQIGG